MPSLERARAKHNDLIKQLGKLSDKRERALATLTRIDAKRTEAIRAVARSSKRLEKLITAKTHNNRPTATPVPAVIATDYPAAKKRLDDPLPEFAKRGKRTRRSPDDFKADMAKRKPAPTEIG